MKNSITWLHISDIHARVRNDWDSRGVLDALVSDIKLVAKSTGFRPDFIIVTGDIAFGTVQSDTLDEQYTIAQKFFDAILNSFNPPISKRNLYIVPGNHDIDRSEITPGERDWLRNDQRTIVEIQNAMQSESRQWRAWMDRFSSYRNFLRQYGLTHLKPDDPHLVWSDVKNIGTIRVGICGFNSAWSAADDSDKGKLWVGLPFQISKNISEMGPVDLSLALIHHPGNWFTSAEDPSSMRQLRQQFQIVAHGHEHQEWIEESTNGHLLISAGACYESSWMENGYNWSHLDLNTGNGAIWLRQWDSSGRGWVARNVHGKTQNGVWPLLNLEKLHRDFPKSLEWASAERSPALERWSADDHFTKIFCTHAAEKFDYLELFGCDIPKELQKHRLSVAYVSLNFTPRPDLIDGQANPSEESPLSIEQDPTSQGNASDADLQNISGSNISIGTLLSRLPAHASRLLILGPAGAGKSTLLRWCAIHSAKLMIQQLDSSALGGDIDVHSPQPAPEKAWTKIPILLRLRDFKDGRIPPATDFPKIVAKHLQAAPADWIFNTLRDGHAIILIDGVDEVHSNFRALVAQEVQELVSTYPNCTYIVTSRPGAIPSGWLDRSGFQEVTVEPMDRHDREEFITKWYSSASLELARKARGGEDFNQTALNLKTELADQPDLGMLASNPLLCAMICALYRERQENLPESPSELCEALVHMLVHRRERETSDLTDAHFDENWRRLIYAQKKGILSDLAFEMVSSEESTMERRRAREIVGAALQLTPGHSESESSSVLEAIVERSGLLRPAGDDQIEFIHNTLKEYLAATVIVETNMTELCIEKADEQAWQPTILFALSLAAEEFSSRVVGSLLSRFPTKERAARNKKNLTRAQKEALQLENARAFFLVRSRKSVKRLNPDLSEKIVGLTKRLLPPAYMHDVEPLAHLGTKLLVQGSTMFGAPRWWAQQDARMAVRCLRLLRLIGGTKAKTYLSAIQKLVSGSSLLTGEWMLANSELHDSELDWPFEERRSVNASSVAIDDIRGLPFATMTNLDLSWSRVHDLSPLRQARVLKQLNVMATEVPSLEPIGQVVSIETLQLSHSNITDLSPISDLRKLRAISIIKCDVSELDPIAQLEELVQLLAAYTKIERIPANNWKRLIWIDVSRSKISDADELSTATSLQRFHASGTRLTSLKFLQHFRDLRSLDLSHSSINAIPNLSQLKFLNRVVANSSSMSDLGFLSESSSTRSIDISNTKVSNLEGISSCKNLSTLNIARTSIRDLSPLSNHPALKNLNIIGLDLASLKPIEQLQEISTITLDADQVDALIAIKLPPTIRSISISGNISEHEGINILRARHAGADISRVARIL